MDEYREHGSPVPSERRFEELADLQASRGLYLPEIRELLALLDARRPPVEFFGNQLGRALRMAGVKRASGRRPRRLLRNGR